MIDLIGIPEACKRSGHCRPTLQKWIDNGWLRTEEMRYGNFGGVRQFTTLEWLRDAEEMAANAPRERVNIWMEGGVSLPIPRKGTSQYRAMEVWLKGKGCRVLE